MHKVWSAWFAAFCLATAACAATAKEPKATRVAVVEDTAISGAVKQAIDGDPLFARHGIYVESYRGAVQLSGWVSTQEQRERAARIASGIAGVRSVNNELELESERGDRPQSVVSSQSTSR